MFVKVHNKKNPLFAITNKQVNKSDRKENHINKQFLSIILYQNNISYSNIKTLSNCYE